MTVAVNENLVKLDSAVYLSFIVPQTKPSLDKVEFRCNVVRFGLCFQFENSSVLENFTRCMKALDELTLM